jgi:hypothetical protein
MSEARSELILRAAARTVIAALLLAMTLQFLALSRGDRVNIWLTGSLCVRPSAYDTAFAAAGPAFRPENRRPPRKVQAHFNSLQ